MKKAPESVRWAISIGLLLALLGTACGVKGPPVPPAAAPPPPVTELAYHLEDGSVTLTWRLAEPLTGKAARRADFVVFRSRSDLAQEACDTCPLVFEKVGTLPYTDTGGEPFAFDAALERGYRYDFKVRLDINRIAGPDSDRVSFDLE